MKSAYIFHDAFSDPVSDWYPWMKSMLEGMGYFVVIPKFPTPAGQSLESWNVSVKDALPKWDSDTIVIGHGAGGAFALRMIEDAAKPIHGLFLVASYASKIGHTGFDRVNESFFAKPFDWNKIKENAMVVESFSGQNDPFVPQSASEDLAKNLDVQNQIIPDGGHVTRADGFAQCVPVLQGIKESMATIEKSITPESALQQNPEFESLVQALPADLKKRILSQKNSPVDPNLGNSAGARTMYQDMATLVNSNKGSVASSLLSKARQDEAVKKSASPKSAKNVFYIIGTIIVIAVALGIVGYLMYQSVPATVAPTATPIASIILADSHVKIDISNQTSYAVESAIRTTLAQPVDDSTIRDIVYVNGNSRISLNAVLSAIGVSAPSSLAGELNDPTFMHGEASFNGVTSHFLVIPITNYDTAFSGMTNWEPTVVRDLGIFFNIPDEFLKTETNDGTFENVMIQNNPVRAVYYHATSAAADTTAVAQTTSLSAAAQTAQTQTPAVNFTAPDLPNPLLNIVSPYKDGDLMLAYFFINENTLVITDSTAIIPQLLERYADSQIYK